MSRLIEVGRKMRPQTPKSSRNPCRVLRGELDAAIAQAEEEEKCVEELIASAERIGLFGMVAPFPRNHRIEIEPVDVVRIGKALSALKAAMDRKD